MRRAGAGLIAAVLALAGCKGTDSKSSDDRPLFAGIASRNKSKDKDKDKDKDAKAGATGLSWLDDGKLPGAGTSIPKASGAGGDPTAPNFNAKTEAQDAIGGRVFDTNGKPARNIFIAIEEAGAATSGPAAMGIYTDNNGYFFTRGLKPGKAYDLTAKASQQSGKSFVGVVQTLVPNPTLTIELRDDLPLPPGTGAPPQRGPGGAFPPVPKPSDKIGESVPPGGPSAPKPSDGSYAPSGGSTTGVPPSVIEGTKPPPTGGGTGTLPPPDDLSLPPAPKPVRPESTAEGQRDPNQPPPASIPNPNGPPSVPPVPPVPALPPSFAPSGGGGRSAMSAPPRFTLVDTLDRTWSLESMSRGSLVLIEFVTSTCEHSQKAVPILKDLQARYGASGLQIIGVMCDDLPQKDRAATAAKYSRDYNLNYALYVEPGAAGTVRDRFNVESYPHAVLLDATGKVLWRGHPGKKAELEAAIKQNLGK